MAVVQISKIQVRRGKKNQGTGMPQLASGEIAWAIDTQELFIGNGAVSEGAPFVGNTKIITENDSVLEIAAQYQYFYDPDLADSSLLGTVKRSIQSRLDDGVTNAKNFGITANDPANQYSKIQTAITEVATKNKVFLEFDAGEFKFSNSISLPSNTKIKGQGKEVTILHCTTLGTAFNSLANAENIILEDLTLKISSNNSTILVLNNAKNCVFNNVKFVFDDGTAVIAGNLQNSRIGLNLVGSEMILSNNIFSNVEFSRLTYGVFSNSGGSYNNFKNCYFNNLYKGVLIGSLTSRSSYNIFVNNIFDDVLNEGIDIVNGYGNKSISNTYKNVGSSLGGSSSTSNIINFRTDGNSSIDDFFERSIVNLNNKFLPEISGVSYYSKSNPTRITLNYVNPDAPEQVAFTIPLNNVNGLKIEYLVNSLFYNVSRRGTMNIIIDRDSGEFEISDEFETLGDVIEFIIFTGSIEDQFGSKVLKIKYKNDLAFVNDQNELTYTYSVLS